MAAQEEVCVCVRVCVGLQRGSEGKTILVLIVFQRYLLWGLSHVNKIVWCSVFHNQNCFRP